METNCKEEMVRALLLAGAEVNPVSRGEFPTLLRAVINTDISIIRLLLQAGADPNVHYDTGDPSTVKQDGTTPLIAAARRGEVVIASLLLEAGADRHARDRTGRTALMRAIEWGTTEVVDLLTEI
jgi:ankyrin repeat protein